MSSKENTDLSEAIRQTGEELRYLQMFVNICVRALDQSTKAVEQIDLHHKIARFLAKPEIKEIMQPQEPDAETCRLMTEEELLEAKKQAAEIEAFAQKQKEYGFPYLFSLAIVRLWSILESMVDDLVVNFLHRPDDCKDKDFIYSLKGPLLEFINAPPERQADFLTERLKDAVKAGLQSGVGRFEAMLDPIGLGGGINPDVRRVIFELSQIRNVIVHKAGIADQRFVEACPWLNLQPGMAPEMNGTNFHLYILSAYYYAVELRIRTDRFLGCEAEQSTRDMQGEIANCVRGIILQRENKTVTDIPNDENALHCEHYLPEIN